MAFKFSTELRRRQCVVGSLKSILDGGSLRWYSGPVPASADSGLLSSNVLLNEMADLEFEGTASGATLTKSLSQTWQTNNIANGECTFARYVLPADTGSNTPNDVRMQATVGGPDADITIGNKNFLSGAPLRLEYFAIALLEYA